MADVPSLDSVEVSKRDEAGIFGWKTTSRIEAISTPVGADGTVRISFPHTMAGKWPVLPYPFDTSVTIEATLWCIIPVDGKWIAVTCHWVRPGQTSKELDPSDWPSYDLGLPPGSARIAPGTLVGFFVSTPARLSYRGPVLERSGVVWTKLGSDVVLAREGDGVQTMTIQQAVQNERAKYGASPTADQCVAICNDAAYSCRDQPEKWGVSTKNDGDNGTRSDGKKCAKDIIQNGVTLEIFDVLVAAGDGGPATPSWQPKGVLNDPNRPYLAPIPPSGVTPPDPPDPPQPPSNVATAEQLAKHDAEIKAALQSLGASLPALVPVLTNTLRAMLAATTFEGEARIWGQTLRFTLKPKINS